MKKLISLSLIFFFLCLLAGSVYKGENRIISNKKDDILFDNSFIMLSISPSKGGEIVQTLAFGVDDKLVKTNERASFIACAIENVQTLRNEFLFSLASKYIQNKNDEYKIGSGVVLSNAVYDENAKSVLFSIIFKNSGSWKYYHSSGQTQKDKNESFYLAKKVTLPGIFPFSEEITVGNEKMTIGERYKDIFTSSARDLESFSYFKNNYNPTFVYMYGTNLRQLKSDANKTKTVNGVSYHFWVKGEDGKDQIIKFYYYKVNYAYIYLILISSVLIILCVSIPLILHFEKNKLKTKENVVDSKSKQN